MPCKIVDCPCGEYGYYRHDKFLWFRYITKHVQFVLVHAAKSSKCWCCESRIANCKQWFYVHDKRRLAIVWQVLTEIRISSARKAEI